MSYFSKIMIYSLFVLFCFSFTFPAVVAADPPDQESRKIISSLNRKIPELMEAASIPGLQIALIRDGRVVWEKGYGVKNAETGSPVTKDTLFESASLTKPFFAFLTMKLVEDGKINLDKPLMNYVPRKMIEQRMGHSMDEKGFRKDWLGLITPRMVLSHSSGLPHGEGGKIFPILFKPGSKWKYSATGYGFLQIAVEVILKEKLGSLMKKYYIDPLGMKNSSMVWKGEYEKTMASGHNWFGQVQAFRKRARATAAASLYTTAGDYAKFICAVMNRSGMKKETMKTMLTPAIEMEEGEGLGWGLGFGTQTDASGFGFWQWGDYGIFRNYILAYPEKKTAVVYLTNSAFGLSIADEITRTAVNAPAGGALAMGYDKHDSPFMKLGRSLLSDESKDAGSLYEKMKKEFGYHLPDQRVAALAGLLAGSGRGKQAVDLFHKLIPGDPNPPDLKNRLAEAYLGLKEYQKAKVLYGELMKGLKKEGKKGGKVEWYLGFVKAMENPIKVDPELLKKLAGEYGPRHFKVQKGKLMYKRSGSGVNQFRVLIPMKGNLFFMEEVPYFRIKFEFDVEGNPVKAFGLYDDGRTDSNPRTK